MGRPLVVHICGGTGPFKVGDPKPEGYGDRIEWAEVHMKAKVKQYTCSSCSLWHFATEMSPHVEVDYSAFVIEDGRRKPVRTEHRYCLECVAEKPRVAEICARSPAPGVAQDAQEGGGRG